MTSSLLDSFRMDGRVAVVTGSGRGIGAGIALGFADAGAHVVLTARRESDLAEISAEVIARGVDCLVVPGDIHTSVPTIVARTVERFGRLDTWVSNAGGSEYKGNFTLLDMPEEHWDAQLDLNLKTHFLAVKHAVPIMQPGSCLIGIASTAALGPAVRYGAYGAAKAGMISMAKTLSIELGPRGIRANTVSPGIVPTESLTLIGGVDDAALESMRRTVPLGRLGTPADVAAACLLLASDAGSWITGQNIVVSGGR